MTKYNKQLGAEIRKKRRDREITVTQLAKYMGVHRNTIARWEAGLNEVGTENLDIIAKLFGISINLLLPKINKREENAKTKK